MRTEIVFQETPCPWALKEAGIENRQTVDESLHERRRSRRERSIKSCPRLMTSPLAERLSRFKFERGSNLTCGAVNRNGRRNDRTRHGRHFGCHVCGRVVRSFLREWNPVAALSVWLWVHGGRSRWPVRPSLTAEGASQAEDEIRHQHV